MGSREIALIGCRSFGRSAIVDTSDYDALSRQKWFVSAQGYPATRKDQQTVTMHRFLLGRNGSLEVDHANRNKLDNRRANLRWVTRAANIANSIARRNCASTVKGVRRARKGGKWHAQIRCNGKLRFIGSYETPEAAGRAFAEAHRELYGEA